MNIKMLGAFAAVALLAACAKPAATAMSTGTGAAMTTGPAPGSEEDLVANVGDRVFYGFNATSLSTDATRHGRVQPGPRPAACGHCPRLSGRPGRRWLAHPDHQLRQGSPGGAGWRRGFLFPGPQRDHLRAGSQPAGRHRRVFLTIRKAESHTVSAAAKNMAGNLVARHFYGPAVSRGCHHDGRQGRC
jgi:hypothetical protein